VGTNGVLVVPMILMKILLPCSEPGAAVQHFAGAVILRAHQSHRTTAGRGALRPFRGVCAAAKGAGQGLSHQD